MVSPAVGKTTQTDSKTKIGGPKIAHQARTTSAYQIKKGDTLSALARANGTSVKELQALNPKIIKDVNRIFAGDTIRLPGSSQSKTKLDAEKTNTTGAKDLPKGVKGLLDGVSKAEGTSDAQAKKHGFDSGYDVPLGYGAYGKPSKPLSKMTLGEVKAFQRQMLRNPKNKFNSSAVGRYQIVGRTLRGLQKQMKLPDSAVFSPELQDKMATKLLERRGLGKFQSGRMSPGRFQNSIAKEWASIPRSDTGHSHYGQRIGLDQAVIQALLGALR